MKRVRRGGAAALILALGLAGGCDDNGSSGGTASPASFTDRLALLPRSVAEGADAILVQMADLDRAAELAGVDRPADLADEDAVAEYLRAVQGQGDAGGPRPEVAALLPERVGTQGTVELAEFEAELGWSAVDVDWYAELPTPPVKLAVLGGDFEEEQLTDAMGAAGEDGIWRLGGEDGTVDLNEVSAARPLGEPLRLALEQGRLFVSNETGPVEQARGDGETLAEVAELHALTEAMDDEGGYSALFSLDERDRPAPVPGDDPAGLEPFLGVATGLAHDGEPYVVLAYAHDDASVAEANAETIRVMLEEGSSFQTNQPWADLLAVDEIRVDETTVVARLALRDAHPAIAYDLLWSQDSLVVHG